MTNIFGHPGQMRAQKRVTKLVGGLAIEFVRRRNVMNIHGIENSKICRFSLTATMRFF